MKTLVLKIRDRLQSDPYSVLSAGSLKLGIQNIPHQAIATTLTKTPTAAGADFRYGKNREISVTIRHGVNRGSLRSFPVWENRPPQFLDQSTSRDDPYSASLNVEQLIQFLDGTESSAIGTREQKKLASFIGRVESCIGSESTVTLLNQSSGERLEAECDADLLRQNDIGEGDEFICEVLRIAGSTSVTFKKLQPKTITREQLQKIEAKAESRWS